MRFRSFQTRVQVLFLGLFVAVLASVLLLVDAANTRNARVQIDDALEVGSGVFRRLVDSRTDRLLEAARLLSGDFAFASAYATRERATILSALENHGRRIGADWMSLASMDYEVLADTLHPDSSGRLPFAAAIDGALEQGRLELATFAALDGALYQVVVVPLRIPLPEAWISVGFRIDDDFANEFRQLTLSDVSLLTGSAQDGWLPIASTLPADGRDELARAIRELPWSANHSETMRLADERWVVLVTALGEVHGPRTVVAVLQRSLERALVPHVRLRGTLLAVFAAALALCLLLGVRIARSVSRPVLTIAAGAERVERGDYSGKLQIDQSDEIGALAQSFNHMVQGLEERKRVRELLGKVVSPAIAQELLRRPIELGGEEREVTILFADLRGFTTWCEGAPPGSVLAILNRYLTRMTAVVESHRGVVDKYIGDALMALFGAPLDQEEHPADAVAAALDMQRSLAELNAELHGEGGRALRMGIGINTATVLAGNMGSETRLNYTVIGDGVNVSSRLEQLTKRYGVSCVVGDATCRATPACLYRELDCVRVRGRAEPLTIHEPLGRRDKADPATLALVEQHDRALRHWRAREWQLARQEFERLATSAPSTLYELYGERARQLERTAPNSDWCGGLDLDEL